MSLAPAIRSCSRSKYSVAHFSDEFLLRDLPACFGQENSKKAEVLSRIGEVGHRRLFVRAGYPSLLAYCMGALGMSKDQALFRIRAARAAWDFPAIYDAVADGRLELSVAALLKKHLTEESVDELIAAAVGKSVSEAKAFLAQRVPLFDSGGARAVSVGTLPPMATVTVHSSDVPATKPDEATSVASLLPVATVTASSADVQAIGTDEATSVSPGIPMATVIASSTDGEVIGTDNAASVAPVLPMATATEPQCPPSAPAAPPALIAPPKFPIHFAAERETHELLHHAQDLLSHQVPSASVAEVFYRALVVYVRQLEKQKYAATDKPRAPRKRTSSESRYIPAHVKRAVRERDGDQCTFVGDGGHRCESRRVLEYDHIQEFARGGEATVENLRLRCRVHNQYGAEQTFGAEFMRQKREGVRRKRGDA